MVNTLTVRRVAGRRRRLARLISSFIFHYPIYDFNSLEAPATDAFGEPFFLANLS
jgi:hypothetical protein